MRTPPTWPWRRPLLLHSLRCLLFFFVTNTTRPEHSEAADAPLERIVLRDYHTRLPLRISDAGVQLDLIRAIC